MNKASEIAITNKSLLRNIISWVFGIVAGVIGVINMFWGNDPGYGVFIFLLAFIYFPPATVLYRKIFNRSIPAIVKVILGAFILWSALGVGELFDKIELMMNDF